MYIQGVDSVYDRSERRPVGKTTYGDVFHQNEAEQSTYNSGIRGRGLLFTCFEQYEKEAQRWRWRLRPPPAYERIPRRPPTASTCWTPAKPSP